MRLSSIALAALLSLPLGYTQEQRLEFEVASVRPAMPLITQGAYGAIRSPNSQPPPRPDAKTVSYRSVTLAVLIRDAYEVEDLQIQGPRWIRTALYDVEAKVPEFTPPGRIPAMLKTLLADRFHLSAHFPMVSEPGFELTVGKDGAKLVESVAPQVLDIRSVREDGRYAWKAITMDHFARDLWSYLRRPVIDKTGLSGFYDIQLNADPTSMGSSSPSVNSQYPSVFVAIRKLGLLLEPHAISVRHVVVDSALQVPIPN